MTPGQRATTWFFLTIAGLFLAQALLGAAAEHDRADTASFFGLDLAKLLPYNLARTWHVQLSLFWTAAGIFLTPFIAGREPRKQSTLVCILFVAVVLVIVGSLLSEALSIQGVTWAKGPLFELRIVLAQTAGPQPIHQNAQSVIGPRSVVHPCHPDFEIPLDRHSHHRLETSPN